MRVLKKIPEKDWEQFDGTALEAPLNQLTGDLKQEFQLVEKMNLFGRRWALKTAGRWAGGRMPRQPSIRRSCWKYASGRAKANLTLRFRKMKKQILVALLYAFILLAARASAEESWLKSSGFGLMFHYECFQERSARDFNKAVDSFDVERFADAVASTRAGHVIFTIGQHTGKFCAPNAAYEKLLGVKNGEWTSRRDLILEIAKALEKRDVRLIIYMTARAPMRNYRVIEAMGDTLPTINGKPAGPKVNPMSHPRKLKGFLRSENQAPNPVFLKNWADVCGEWSRRYGKRVSGWWFDGYKDEMKVAYEPLQKERHNIDTWLAAVRSGNPAAELAFNAGAHPLLSLCTRGKLCPLQTFTAGEQREFTFKNKPLTPKNFPAPEGVTWHLLLSVSDGWGAGTKSRFDAATLAERIGVINAQDGTVTLDVPIAANGAIPKAVLTTLQQLRQLK
jgi:hypothetical protein